MSDMVNPYKSPESAVNPVKPLVSQGTLTEAMLMHLKGASPWLRFIGVIGFIVSGFLVLVSLAVFSINSTAISMMNERLGVEVFSSGNNFVLGIYLLLLTPFIFFVSYFSYNFGAKIRSFLRTGVEQDLEKALKSNKSLWKFIGILIIVMLAIIPASMIIGIIMAVAVSL
jgi:hypothetical protein